MFDKSVLKGFRTVGSFIIYEDTFAFMIGPDKTGERLGIVRIGGHIEGVESLAEALKREVLEEASINVDVINSPKTFYKKTWENEYSEIENFQHMKIKPLIIQGNENRASTIFLSYANEEPKASSEAYGIVFLRKSDIKEICTNKLTLSDFVNKGGKLIQQKDMDFNMEIYAGVHLLFLNRFMDDEKELIDRFINRELD